MCGCATMSTISSTGTTDGASTADSRRLCLSTQAIHGVFIALGQKAWIDEKPRSLRSSAFCASPAWRRRRNPRTRRRPPRRLPRCGHGSTPRPLSRGRQGTAGCQRVGCRPLAAEAGGIRVALDCETAPGRSGARRPAAAPMLECRRDARDRRRASSHRAVPRAAYRRPAGRGAARQALQVEEGRVRLRDLGASSRRAHPASLHERAKRPGRRRARRHTDRH